MLCVSPFLSIGRRRLASSPSLFVQGLGRKLNFSSGFSSGFSSDSSGSSSLDRWNALRLDEWEQELLGAKSAQANLMKKKSSSSSSSAPLSSGSIPFQRFRDRKLLPLEPEKPDQPIREALHAVKIPEDDFNKAFSRSQCTADDDLSVLTDLSVKEELSPEQWKLIVPVLDYFNEKKMLVAIDEHQNGTPSLNSLSSLEPLEDLNAPQRFVEELEFRTLRLRPISIKIVGGKRNYFHAFSCCGNGHGGIGLGVGRGSTPANAILKSQKKAVENMEYFPLFEDRTIFHDQYLKLYNCKLTCWSVPPKNGIRAHHTIQMICYAMGLKDLSAKVYGATNPITVARAFLAVLRLQKTPEQVALDSGLFVHDINEAYRHQHRVIMMHNMAVEKNASKDSIFVEVNE